MKLPTCNASGPWDLEPWAREWRDPATGLKCLILKHQYLLTLCGYVRIMRNHPMYNKCDPKFDRLDVHGGVTFARRAHGSRYMKRGFWIGFDCGHCMDLVPGTIWAMPDSILPGTYRDGAYVKAEVERLAKQLGLVGANLRSAVYDTL